MYSAVMTGAVHGISSYLLRVETNISNGLPAFNMVGFMSGEVREAGERVRVALKNTGIPLPAARITVNLAPADIPKRGIVIDLPVAVGELICMEMLRQEDFEDEGSWASMERSGRCEVSFPSYRQLRHRASACASCRRRTWRRVLWWRASRWSESAP